MDVCTVLWQNCRTQNVAQIIYGCFCVVCVLVSVLVRAYSQHSSNVFIVSLFSLLESLCAKPSARLRKASARSSFLFTVASKCPPFQMIVPGRRHRLGTPRDSLLLMSICRELIAPHPREKQDQRLVQIPSISINPHGTGGKTRFANSCEIVPDIFSSNSFTANATRAHQTALAMGSAGKQWEARDNGRTAPDLVPYRIEGKSQKTAPWRLVRDYGMFLASEMDFR